jgi:hypothetical protein
VYSELALQELITARARQPGAAVMDPDDYRSRFTLWEERASVRRKPQRLLHATSSDQVYFPPELAPAVQHPLVVQRGSEAIRELLVYRLYDYLHFTTELEQLAVIPVTTQISRGRAGLELSGDMRLDAFKIVTDEAWHAQFSFDLMRQVERETGVPIGRLGVPAFTSRLDLIRHNLPDDVRGAEALLFAVVSETLISSILADIPHDQRLPVAVRDLVQDHAEDEGRHHAYFRDVLRRFWPALGQTAQRRVGPYLPEMIRAFLDPDYTALVAGMGRIGLNVSEVRQVVEDTWPESRLASDAALAASAAVRYFTEVGALEDLRTLDAFHAAGLLQTAA